MFHFLLRSCLAALICGYASSMLFSQAISFQKTYGGPTSDESSRSVIETSDGYLIAGTTNGNSLYGYTDGLFIRLDKYGNILWKKNYGGPFRDEFDFVITANDGGFLACGHTLNVGTNYDDFWLVKVDDAGNVLWQKTIGEPLYTEWIVAPPLAVPGGYLLSGHKVFFGSFITRIDNQGEVVWSRFHDIDAQPNIYSSSNMFAGYATDSLVYVGGATDSQNAGFMTLDLTTGNIVQAMEWYNPGRQTEFESMQPTLDGNLIVTGYTYTAFFSPDNPPAVTWIQKMRPNGQVIWSKTYQSADAAYGVNQINTLADGGFIVHCNLYNAVAVNGKGLMKLDSNGEVIWTKYYGKINGFNIMHQLLVTADGGFAVADYNFQDEPADITLLKTDANGDVAGCCIREIATTSQDFILNSRPTPYTERDYVGTTPRNFQTNLQVVINSQDFCNYVPSIFYDTLQFCPGQSIALGGMVYNQPTIIIDTLHGGCDTLLVHVLEYKSDNQSSVLHLVCPANIVVTVPADVISIPVNYDLPTASSDCICPNITTTLIEGGASESNFSVGINSICYRAEDACGQTKTCCFTVSITPEENGCDVKDIGCLSFELLSINRDVEQDLVYRIRVTNHCSAAVTYAYLQVPSSIEAVAPANNSTYTASSGRTYTVRNPNFSPFYSVRFQPNTATLVDGQSEVFRYVLPAQADPDYLHVAARLVHRILSYLKFTGQ